MSATRDVFAGLSLSATPQTQRVPGRTDQVRNNAGGYVFAKDLWNKVEDFLVLGTTGGTHHVGQDKLNAQNLDWLLDAIKQDGARVVELIVDVTTGRPPRAPKPRPAIFALAVVFAVGDPAAVQAAKKAFPKVVRTTDHLAMFFGYSKQARGKTSPMGTSLRAGRALRTAIGSWFFPPADGDMPSLSSTAEEWLSGNVTPRYRITALMKVRPSPAPTAEQCEQITGEVEALAREIMSPSVRWEGRDQVHVSFAWPGVNDVEAARSAKEKLGRVAALAGIFVQDIEVFQVERITLEHHQQDRALRDTAWKVCKARQRKTPAGETFMLRDALRIAHGPRAAQLGVNAEARRALLGWVAGSVTDEQARAQVQTVDDFLTAQAVTSEDEALRVVTARGVPWEFLPSQYMKSAKVWEALASTVGMTALIRNLALMTRLGVLAPMAVTNKTVVARLTNGEALNKARVHPVDVFLALRVYGSGQSQPNPKAPIETWTPVAEIRDALEEAYDLSFGHVQPSGRTYILAVDSSGSMGAWSRVTMGGSPLGTAYEVACSMAVMLKRIEGGNIHVIDVDTDVHASPVTARTNLREIASWCPGGGGTDLSLPFTYAWRVGLQVDGFAVLTDGETWAGWHNHPFQALKIYRDNFNPAARVVVASMCATGHSIMEPGDPGVLQVAGVDSSLPRVVTGFFRTAGDTGN